MYIMYSRQYKLQFVLKVIVSEGLDAFRFSLNRYNTNTLSIPSSPSFFNEVASSKMNLHGGWFRK